MRKMSRILFAACAVLSAPIAWAQEGILFPDGKADTILVCERIAPVERQRDRFQNALWVVRYPGAARPERPRPLNRALVSTFKMPSGWNSTGTDPMEELTAVYG